MSKVISFAKEKAKRIKARSKNSILEFLQDAGVQIENVQVNVDQDDEIEIFFEPEDTNCLLYTSPSPRDPIGSRMPSSA